MAAFNVTALSDFGYPETTRFIDPMEDRFRAKPYTGTTIPDVQTILASFSALNAYSNVADIEEALDEYWETH